MVEKAVIRLAPDLGLLPIFESKLVAALFSPIALK